MTQTEGPAPDTTEAEDLPWSLIADHAPSVLMLVDAALEITWMSGAAYELFAHTAEECVGRSVLEFIDPEWDDPIALRSVMTAMEMEGPRLPTFFRILGLDGRPRMVEVTANSQFHDPQLRCMVVTVSPADERFLLDQTLESMAAGRPLDETLRHLVHIAEADTLGADATILYDLDAGNSPSRQSTHTNGLADLLAGRRPESGADPWTRVLAGAGPRIWDIDRLPTALAQAADAARYTSCWVWPAVIDDGRQGTVVAWRTDERFEREETRVVMDRLARVAGLVIDKGRSDDLISWAANHDPLTGLANRARFYSELESALSPENEAPQAAPGNIVGVIAIDLDDFKPINDQHGHGAGDEVLRLISQRIVSSVGENGLSARIGGDEFVVVLAGVDDDASLEQIGIDLLASLNQPLDWSHGPPISVAASIGVAGCVPGVCSSDLLVEAADTALYAAKAEGNTVVRAGDAAGASQSRVTRRAIARDPQSPRAERT